MQALDDLVVLDLTQHIAGPYATRLLADYGADVIKVEPPGGDVARALSPHQGHSAHPERSGLYFYLNCNKRGIVLDLATSDGRATLGALATRADLVVESYPPGALAAMGVGYDFFRAVKPSLPVVSITSFGQTGPYRDYHLTELPLFAFAGEMYSMGLPDREPVKMAGTAALFESGAAAAVGLMAALFAARRHGIGQHVDVALADTQLGSVDRRMAAAIAFQFSGHHTVRAAAMGAGTPQGIYPCADGYVDFTSGFIYPERVAEMLGHPDWLREERFSDPAKLRTSPALIAEWNVYFLEWCLARTKREIWEEARRARLLCGPLFTMADLHEDEHFRSRGFWASIDHAAMGTVEMAGRPFIMEQGGWQLRRPAPLLGEHTEEVMRELSMAGSEKVARTAARSTTAGTPQPIAGSQRQPGHDRPIAQDSRNRRPLDGIRVVDLCVVWAGPFGTMLLADLGAEVIKVENPFAWQPITRAVLPQPPKAVGGWSPFLTAQMPGGVAGDAPWNYSPTFAGVIRNKRSFTTNLLRPEGLDVLRRLVAVSDVVYDNNATGTLEKLGISNEWLRAANPNIIFVRVPAYDSSGPYHDARALGVHLEAVMGHTLLRGYTDSAPSANTAIYSGDYFAGVQGAFATMTALRHRERTGEGQLVEVAQAEVASAMFTQAMMDYTLNGVTHDAGGNGDVHGRVPCGVYPARSQGTAADAGDRWIAIHVEDDDRWRSFVEALGSPSWGENPRFATNDGRAACRDELDALIAEATRDCDDYELFHRLQRAGVSAAPVLEAARMFSDPHFRQRNLFHPLQIAGTDRPYEYVASLWQLPATPADPYRAPVTFGEDNEYVYREVLKVSDEEYARYEALGFIATRYDQSIA
jgi:crotonobetainyl-CoA:carnitine CoA-transferase CaiB-like acyl-CoA transferase